ncbi:MAG: hypothetical protein EP343_09565 [Deltaproteobacteria bacterium]|nr:MAG: hypothetical protein EP343_09565 [Deltaproteobacteria bacterium]
MMSIYLVIVLPLGFILGGLAGLLFNQQKKMEVYNETQGQLHYWQEQLEDFFPFQGMVGNEIESGAFETGEEVTAVGLVWVDDENGVMVECHGSGKQSDLPLLNLVVPETSEVFTHLMAYKRERGHFR